MFFDVRPVSVASVLQRVNVFISVFFVPITQVEFTTALPKTVLSFSITLQPQILCAHTLAVLSVTTPAVSKTV